jgi:hypothetical protein
MPTLGHFSNPQPRHPACANTRPASTAGFGSFCSRLIAALSLVAVCLALPPLGRAQIPNALGNLTLGQPVIANGTGGMNETASSSPLSLDVSQFGGDICAKLHAAMAAASTAGIGVLDATAFTGAPRPARRSQRNLGGSWRPLRPCFASLAVGLLC